ncbi:hypothetical protein B0H10DRAFT_2024697 [Mycena sp. CBHHK59/15]|nr:hypothetical protein B0H10DRAFT_2024697 [Mycena sp. CBHHK59/15]
MDDVESLFGSPPPTPTRGRSPSPALALPSASANINLSSSSAQNVGTIALPGSHHFSELPVNPLALSLSFPSSINGDALRPPAQERGGFVTQVRSRVPAATPVLALLPASSSTKRKPTRKSKARSTATTARPSPPPIHLPDPSESSPLPPNLLRNQPGLLGTAGVVAGVRPAHLPAPSAHTQGTTSSNPIFVDDIVQPASISRFKRPRSDLDLDGLPPPTNQDIVATLIKQRDIFPVLESILKLIATEPPHQVSGFSRGQSQASSDAGSRSQTPSDEPTTTRKRRKLNHVPAGAELWDVPFPFKEGEGPEAYRNNWEKDRGKKLIAELVTLIKDAAKKTAVKNYLEERRTPTEAELATIGKHYRVDTLFYGTSTKTSATEVLADASNAKRPPVPSSVEPPPPPPPTPLPSPRPLDAAVPVPANSTPFDKLITSLLSASSNETSHSDINNSARDVIDPSSQLDMGLFNSWMDIFQTFPVPPEGFTPDFQTEDYAGIDSKETFFPMPEMLPNRAQDLQSSALFAFPSETSHTFPIMTGTTATQQNFYPTLNQDLMIDPVLLALSAPSVPSIDTSGSASVSNYSDSGCPSLSGSPIPSGSSYSFGDNGPMTPTEAAWDGDMGIGVYSPGEEQRLVGAVANVQPPSSDKGKGKQRAFGDLTGWSDAEIDALSFLDTLSKSKGKAKAKADKDGGQDGGAGGDVGQEGKDADFSMLPTVPIVGSWAKADVLKRAKERKKQLTVEIARTRITLWETTIEGGVLAGLVKYHSKS